MKTITWAMLVVTGIGTGLAGFHSARTFLSPWRSIERSGALTVMVGESCPTSMRVADHVLSSNSPDSSCRVVVVPVSISDHGASDEACGRAIEMAAADGPGAIEYLPAELACRWLVADALSRYRADGQVVLPVWYRDGEQLDQATQESLTRATLSGRSLCSLATQGPTPDR